MCTWTRDVWWLIVGLIVDVIWVAPPQVRPHKQFLFLEVFQRSEIKKSNDYQHGCFKFPHTHTHQKKTHPERWSIMNHHEPPFIKSKSDGQLLDLSGLAILEADFAWSFAALRVHPWRNGWGGLLNPNSWVHTKIKNWCLTFHVDFRVKSEAAGLSFFWICFLLVQIVFPCCYLMIWVELMPAVFFPVFDRAVFQLLLGKTIRACW